MRKKAAGIRNKKRKGRKKSTKPKPSSRFRDLLHSSSTCSIIQLNFQSGKCRRNVWFLSIMTCKIVHALTFFPMLEKMIFNPDLKIVCFFPTSLCGVLVFGCVLPVRLPPPPPPATCPQLDHTQLTHNLLTHNLSTHNLPTHTQHTHTQLTHTHTQKTHTQLTHTQLAHTQKTHTQLTHTHNLLTATWHLATDTFTLRGRRGVWWHRPSLCVAGVALGDIDLHFAWQVWHLVTSTSTLRGRRGTWWHRPSLCVAGVALGDIDLHFAWQVWHLVTWICTLCGRRGIYGTGLAVVALGSGGHRGTLRGRRGAWWHRPSLCVAGVALGDIDLHFAWQVWHLVTWICTLCGRRGIYGTGLAVVAHGSGGHRGTLRGRRGAWWHRPSLCVAGVALGDIDLHFAWQVWHLVTWICTLCGRRGIYGTGLAVVALGSGGCRGTLRGRRGAWWWHLGHGYITFSTHSTFTHDFFTHTHTRTPLLHTTPLHTLLSPTHFHTELFHTPHFDMHFLHTPILHHFFPLPTFPIPSSPFFGYLLEEVGMWGYPVLLFSWWILCFDPPWICTPSSWHTTIKF